MTLQGCALEHNTAGNGGAGYSLVFGGFDGLSPTDETWIWNGLWTLKNPVDRPPPIAFANMAYDELRQQIVLFGGSEDATSGLLNTWIWDGNDWTERFATNPPPARFSHGMAYDVARQEIVLFGGYDSGNYFNDTWVWLGGKRVADRSGIREGRPASRPPLGATRAPARRSRPSHRRQGAVGRGLRCRMVGRGEEGRSADRFPEPRRCCT